MTRNLIEGLLILSKYLDLGLDGHDTAAEHDVLYVDVAASLVSEADTEALIALRWHVSSDTDGWAFFT